MKTVTQNGLIEILFTNEMSVVGDEMRMLRDEVIESFIAIDIDPSDSSDPKKLTNEWTVESYQPFSMFIKINFDNAVFVSSGVDVDKVRLHFLSE